MVPTKEQLKKAIKELVKEGDHFIVCETVKKMENLHSKKKNAKEPKTTEKNKSSHKIEDFFKPNYTNFATAYQNWYSKASFAIKQILPDRYDEFVEFYKPSKNRKEITFLTYTISDYLLGIAILDWGKISVFDTTNAFYKKIEQQVAILESCLDRLDSILSNIEGALQAELFDDEISAARDLLKKGHLRSAGALSGVTLERHFTTVAKNHAINIVKKNPTISDFNDLFKDNGIYDTPTWRFIQRLGDIRNLSSHFKGREPSKEEIDEMINGTEKILKTVF